MTRFLFFLLLLCAAVWIGLKVAADPGYALFAYRDWTVEMPLWFSAVLAFATLIVVVILVNIFQGLTTLGRNIKKWKKRRVFVRDGLRTNRGLIALAEGDWRKAERYLTRGSRYSKAPLVNYLAAACAAQEVNAYERRDEYLRRAHKSAPKAEVAIGITQAQLQLNHDQHEQALATLQHLRQIVPHHTYVLKLLKKLYLRLNDQAALAEILPELRHYKAIKQKELQTLEPEVYEKVLSESMKYTNGSGGLTKAWKSLPAHLQKDTRLIKHYVQCLIRSGEHAVAEKTLANTLKKQWDLGLIALYGEVESIDPAKQLAVAESWLKSRPGNATLLRLLGTLSMKQQLWGKARDYLEQSLQLEPHSEGHYALGKLLEALGEMDLARGHYRKAIELSLGRT